MVTGLMTFGVSNLVVAQDEQAQTEQTEQVVAPEQTEVTPAEVETTEEITPAQAEAPKTFRESIKKQFIDGGPGFMGIVLVILLIGMAISIERIIYLTLSTANSKKLLAGIEAKMKNGDVEGAKQLCKDTRGPVASIFTQGLIRYQDGQSLEEVEKAIVSYGSVQNSELESGLREILNLGHTVGRAIETVSGYKLLHGEAVSIGLVAEVKLAEKLGYCTAEDVKLVAEILEKAKLPVAIPDYIDREALVKKLYTDKKVRDGKLRFVLQKGIGDIMEFEGGQYALPVSEDTAREIIMSI